MSFQTLQRRVCGTGAPLDSSQEPFSSRAGDGKSLGRLSLASSASIPERHHNRGPQLLKMQMIRPRMCRCLGWGCD